MNKHTELIERLRQWPDILRRKPLPIEQVIPVLQKAADALESQALEIEGLRKDAERLDWLESSEVMHGFCHMGNGDFRHYALQQKGYPSVRAVLDAAIAAKGG